MWRFFMVSLALIALAVPPRASAQTYDELLKENKELKARLRAITEDDEPTGHKHEHKHDHKHEHGDAHKHDGHGHDHEEYDQFHPFKGHNHKDHCSSGCQWWQHDLHGNSQHNHHGHSEHNGHGNGHNGHNHGHVRHESAFGYPFVHGLRTEIDFIERALELGVTWARNADDGEVDELAFEAELIWAINNRINLIFGVPLISLNPDVGPTTTGVGDLEVGFRFQAWNGKHWLVFFGLNAILPTGDGARDLGSGHVTLEPTFLQLYDFGQGTYVQNVLRWSAPVNVEAPENEFRYDVGLYHTFRETEHSPFFRYLTPLIEVNGRTVLNGPETGRTVIDLTPGVRWMVRGHDDVGIGVSFPVTGDRNFDYQLIFQYLFHF